MMMEDPTEAQRWEEEAGWLCADPEYVLWLEGFGPWWQGLDRDEEWVKRYEQWAL